MTVPLSIATLGCYLHFSGYELGRESQKGRELREINAFLKEEGYTFFIDDTGAELKIIKRGRRLTNASRLKDAKFYAPPVEGVK